MSKENQRKKNMTPKKSTTPEPIHRAGVQVTVNDSWTFNLPELVQQQIASSNVGTAEVTLAYLGDPERKTKPEDKFRQLQRMLTQELIVKGYYFKPGKNPALVLEVICGSARHYMILCLPTHLSPMSLKSHLSQGKYGKLNVLKTTFRIPFRPFKCTQRGSYLWE